MIGHLEFLPAFWVSSRHGWKQIRHRVPFAGTLFSVVLALLGRPALADTSTMEDDAVIPASSQTPISTTSTETIETANKTLDSSPVTPSPKVQESEYVHVRFVGIRANVLSCCSGVPNLFFDVARFNLYALSSRDSIGVTIFTSTMAVRPKTKTQLEGHSLTFAAPAIHFERLLYLSERFSALLDVRAEPLALLWHAHVSRDRYGEEQTSSAKWSWAPSVDASLFAPLRYKRSRLYIVAFVVGFTLAPPDHAANAYYYGAHVDVMLPLGAIYHKSSRL